MIAIKKIKVPLFFWTLALVVLTLPFPKFDINSKAIIACIIAWFIYNSISEKWKNLKKRVPLFFILSSLFWIALLGLLYTQNMGEGLKNLQKSLPFLVFPLIILTIDLNKKTAAFLLKYFSYSVIIASVFALSKAFFLKANNLGSYFHFSRLEFIFDKHNTYFALFSLIAITYFLFNLSRKKWRYVVCILYLFALLYLLSVRISIVGLVVIICVFLISKRKSIPAKYYYVLLLTTLLPILFYFTPSFQDKFNPHTPEGEAISDIGSRKIHWQAAINTFGQDNLLLGAGTGDGHDKLFETYRIFNFETGYVYKYNAHNQYLEILLFYGFIGLFLMALLFFSLIKINIKEGNFVALAIILLFLTFMITESILLRHDGIVVFAIFMTLFSLNENQKKLI